jgi:hypothetical protein
MGYKDQVSLAGLDTSPGFLVKQPQMPHRTLTPSWDRGETQFRIFPAPRENGWFPMRESPAENDFGPAVWAERTVKRFGVLNQFTYCTRVLGAQQSPTDKFVVALYTLINEKPREVPEDWLSWIKGASNQSARLPNKVRTSLFAQGAEIMRQGKLLVNSAGKRAPQFPALLMAPISVQLNFQEAANTRVEGVSLDGLDSLAGTDEATRAKIDELYANAFKLGDWCSIDKGRIIRIYQAPPRTNEKPHYEVKAGDVLNLSSIAKRIQQLWCPWEKLLRFFTAAEQVEMLCKAFPPEAVDYVFASTEYAQYMPVEARGAWQRYKRGEPPVQTRPAATKAMPSNVVAVEDEPVDEPGDIVDDFDLSGSGAVEEAGSASVMTTSGYKTQPAEFSQPAHDSRVVFPSQPVIQPEIPQTNVAGEVDPGHINAAVAELLKSRDAAARANLGKP